ncbi:MAG: PqqD family protein [Gemmatimonadetes bacterium]|nr:PqqD family protein [Gemmatimonadota bacterium]
MDAPLTEGTIIVASNDQVSAPLGGETVVLGMLDGIYYGFESVANRVWELIQQPRSLGSVADVIAAEFDVTRERALNDLLAFASDLRARGLIEVGPVHAAD